MSTDEVTAANGVTQDVNSTAWSRQSSAMILPGAAPAAGVVSPADGNPALGNPALGNPALGEATTTAASHTTSGGVQAGGQATLGPAGRTGAWSSVLSGPALAIAAFAFASAQAVGGLVVGPVSSLIPSAADSPANHVRIIAVIYIGMSCAGAVFAWLALRRVGDQADAPRWASYLAGASIAVCALVALQALLLLMLSILAPSGA